ncbi:helix-turn-helix domain-containing protein, partial [Exiguobacterium sp. 8H]
MINFMDRQSLLAYHLFNAFTPISYQTLSKRFGISTNKVIRDIEDLDYRLPIGWAIVKKKSGGIILQRPQKGTIKDLWDSLNQTNLYFQIVQIILEERPFTQEELAVEFHLTRPTLFRRLKIIKKWAARFNINLDTRDYVQFVGEEDDLRAMIVQFYDIFWGDDYRKNQYFNEEQFILELSSTCQSKSIQINMGAIRRLTILLNIIHSRKRKRKRYKLNSNVSVSKQSLYYQISSSLKTFFPQYDNLNELEKELEYFGFNILSEFRPKNKSEEVTYMRRNLYTDHISQNIYTFLFELSKHFQVSFWADDDLVFDLVNLLQTMYLDNRLRTNSRSSYLLRYYYVYEEYSLFKLIQQTIEEGDFEFIIKDKRFLELNYLEIFLIIKASILRQRSQKSLKVIILTQYE